MEGQAAAASQGDKEEEERNWISISFPDDRSSLERFILHIYTHTHRERERERERESTVLSVDISIALNEQDTYSESSERKTKKLTDNFIVALRPECGVTLLLLG